jgi:hypothetical protein
MSVTTRQNRLLVTQDWKKIYQSFRNADFQSYDFENLRRTMIDYIRTNYPEDFNDYIESSEYLALIDLIAFLGQSIAFRVDLNARENFLELAERRESVLRLARLISYNAKRNSPSKGLLKITNVATTENVVDSNGRNIAGQTITWNDPSNASWYDQFIKVMNAAFPSTQQFGNPASKATIYGIPTEQYRFQGANLDVPVYSFTRTVDGRAMPFEVTSTTFENQTYIYEEAPKVGNKIACIYRDDGRGLGSAASGFFFNFVQGTLNQGTFTINQPSSNQSVDIETPGVNNSDVWLYRLDGNGAESSLWTQVSNFEGNNIIYNSVNKNIRNIYAVLTRAGDRISLQFSDGTFGDLPLGVFRTYYRVSNGLEYTINSRDIRNISIAIPYYSAQNQLQTLTVTMSLTASITNSTTTESNDSIKNNAPQTYYTQNRMITAEDYNISPLSSSTQIAKVKAVNRSSSGVSRYFDLTDPTGKYSSTRLFADDGVLYSEEYNNKFRFKYSSKTDIEGIIYNEIFDILKGSNLRNFYYSKFVNYVTASLNITWNNVTSDVNASSGYVGDVAGGIIYSVGSSSITDLKYLNVGSLVQFTAPDGYYFDTSKANAIVATTSNNTPNYVKTLWAEVVSIVTDGTASGTGVLSTGFGPIVLNTNVPSTLYSNSSIKIKPVITKIIPRWRTTISSSVINTMIDTIDGNKPFGLRYNASVQEWQIVTEANLDVVSNFSLGKQGDATNKNQDASWLILFTTDNEYYTVTSREQRYIFESESQTRFFYDGTRKIYDSRNNKVVKDNITILNVNTDPTSQNGTLPFTVDYKWEVVAEFIGQDGYVDNKKVVITFADTDDNGVVDNPELFDVIVAPSTTDWTKFVLQEKYSISEGQEDYRYVKNENNKTVWILPNEAAFYNRDSSQDVYPQYFYFVNTGVVKKLTSASSALVASLDYKVFKGRDNIKFQYTHNADYDSRIDPAPSNIVDVYVLTKGYDTLFRQWLKGANISKPLPPSTVELYDLVSPNLNLIKSISDEVIYHPVNYKVLFGSNAESNFQSTFKIVKNPGQVISDNDIKTKVVSAIEQFFALDNWDFGDTFYFTELATYVTNSVAPYIANFVIVPRQTGLNFGSLFEIKSASDQIFVSGATVDDIEITTSLTPSTIKAITNIATTEVNLTQQSVTSSPYGATNV